MGAVITGIGLLTPTGVGIAEYWASTTAGTSAVGELTRFDASRYPARLAAEVTGLDPAEHLPARLLPQTDRMTQLALLASDRAFADAGLVPAELPEFRAGVLTASSSGGFEFGHRELHNLWSQGPQYVSAYQSFAWFYAVNSGQISIRHGLRGAGGVVVAEQAGGLDALGAARRRLRDGELETVATGGMESSLSPWGWAAYLASGRLSTRTDPARAYLPFGEDANGWVPGEGGAILVLEDETAALARNARSYGSLAGYASTFDPAPRSGRPPTLRRAAELALDDAGCSPSDIDAVFADGAGVPELDAAEAGAIRELFGPDGVPVTVPKAGTGRLSSGAGPVDVAAALLAASTGVLPPTANVPAPRAGYRIDLVTRPRTARVRTALVLARGHGGFNSAVVLRAPAEPVRLASPDSPGAAETTEGVRR
ncbi:ketosynthase chain-length factor [Amycolatopsis sp. NPDC003676]